MFGFRCFQLARFSTNHLHRNTPKEAFNVQRKPTSQRPLFEYSVTLRRDLNSFVSFASSFECRSCHNRLIDLLPWERKWMHRTRTIPVALITSDRRHTQRGRQTPTLSHISAERYRYPSSHVALSFPGWCVLSKNTAMDSRVQLSSLYQQKLNQISVFVASWTTLVRRRTCRQLRQSRVNYWC